MDKIDAASTRSHSKPYYILHSCIISIVILLLTVYYYYGHVRAYETSMLQLSLGATAITIDYFLYFVPIAYTYILFGFRRGLTALLISLAAILPESVFVSPNTMASLLSISTAFVPAAIALFGIDYQRRQLGSLR